MKGRKIVVNGQTWTWRLGRTNVVAYNGTKKYVAAAHTVKGVSADIWERGKWKRTSDGQLTPVHVANWLKECCHG